MYGEYGAGAVDGICGERLISCTEMDKDDRNTRDYAIPIDKLCLGHSITKEKCPGGADHVDEAFWTA